MSDALLSTLLQKRISIMPTLKDIPNLFAGYDLSGGYRSVPSLGSGETFSQLLALGNKPAAESFALENFRSFGSVARGAMAGQAIRAGVPDWIVEPMSKAFDLIPKVVDGANMIVASVDAVNKGLNLATKLTGTVLAVSGAIAGAASAVPIVGAVVAIGVAIFTAVFAAVMAGKEPLGRPVVDVEAEPIRFDMDADTATGTHLYNIAGSSDWTELFMPPSADPAFKILQLKGGGARWTTPYQDGFGLLPGLADQGGDYQSVAFGQATSIGKFYPSMSKFSMMLWQMAMKKSLQMFVVNSVAIESAWEGYYNALWKTADQNFTSFKLSSTTEQWLRARIRQSASYLRLYECSESPSASDQPPTSFFAGCTHEFKNGKWIKRDVALKPVFRPESVIDAFPRAKLTKQIGELSGLYSDIVKYVCQVHRARAATALGTLLVAYVPSDAPLLVGDPALAKLHTEMRAALLKHPARYQVELDLIPGDTDSDKAFRSALKDSIIPGVAAQATDKLLVKGKRKPGVPSDFVNLAAPGFNPPPRLPRAPDAPGVGVPEYASPPSRGDGGASWFFAVAGGAAAITVAALVARKLSK